MNRLIYYMVLVFFPSHWGMPYKVLKSQSILEIGKSGSNISRECNNLFGMKHPIKRDTMSSGTCRGHAKYVSIFASIYDRFLWDKYNGIKWNGKKLDYIGQVVRQRYNPNPVGYAAAWVDIISQN